MSKISGSKKNDEAERDKVASYIRNVYPFKRMNTVAWYRVSVKLRRTIKTLLWLRLTKVKGPPVHVC